jgi:hypothetical protein
MNGTVPARRGWVKIAALVALAAGGGAGGLYLSGAFPAPPECGGPPPAPEAAGPQRFPLAARDVKDGVEAPTLAVDAAGTLHAGWASQTEEARRTVFVTKSPDGGRTFEAPRAVATTGIYKAVAQMKGKTVARELRSTPHLRAAGAALHLAWTEALPGNAGVQLVLSTSADGGGTFPPPAPVHAGPARPTFTALAVGPGGAVAAAWLDNRGKAQQTFAAVRPAGATAFAPEALVGAGQDGKGVCPCCPTAAAFAPDGTLYVAFRNVSNGHRDIAVGRLRPGAAAFDGPFPVVPDTWKFDGCPHDGPSLAVVGDQLHVVWMDARSGPQRCYHAAAPRASMAFTARELSAIPAGTQGNARLWADPAGRLHAVWEESLGGEQPAADAHAHADHGAPTLTGSGRAVRYATLPPGAATFGPARAVAPRPGAFQTRPALAGLPDGTVVAAWNELDESGKAVVVCRVPADPAGGAPRE